MNGFALVEGAIRSVSPGSDGERVEVVGEDCPFSPDPPALVALQSGSVQPVAALEVTDSALRAGAVAPQSTLSAFGLRFPAARDEHVLELEGRERGVRRADIEPAVERYLPHADPKPP